MDWQTTLRELDKWIDADGCGSGRANGSS